MGYVNFDADSVEPKYAELRTTIEEVGFYVTRVEPMGGWDRVTIASKKFPNGGYTGNSFWATHLHGKWYLGTWGGFVYELERDNTVAECCISWMKRVPSETRHDFEDDIKDRFGLILVPDEEFDPRAHMNQDAQRTGE
jgi:hypothetical protein